MNKECLEVVRNFNSSVDTPEKLEICRQYKNDEICAFDFFSAARDYLDNSVERS